MKEILFGIGAALAAFFSFKNWRRGQQADEKFQKAQEIESKEVDKKVEHAKAKTKSAKDEFDSAYADYQRDKRNGTGR